jgi:tRNA A37 threonylcarbamoyladenosine synthetase subunit TsaC/SUA5/YrdC
VEYLEIQDKLRTIVLTVPKHHLVQQLTMAVADMLKASSAEAARLRATADGLFAMVDSQAIEIEALRAQLAAIRATDNGTIDTEEE